VSREKHEATPIEGKEGPCTIAVWDAATGQLVRSWEHRAGPGLHLLFSPDARLLAAWEPTRPVRVWKVENGQEVGA
jgi:hypothetical protein